MKKVKFLLCVLTGAALLFSACDGIMDKPETQEAPKAGYGKVIVNIVDDNAGIEGFERTVRPSNVSADVYQYFFTKVGETENTTAATKTDNYFSLAVGSYTLKVKGYKTSVSAGNQTLESSGTITVNVTAGSVASVNVPMKEYSSSTIKGTLSCIIQVPPGTSAGDVTVKLYKPDLSEQAYTSGSLSNGVYTITDTTNLAGGSYLLSVTVKVGGKSAGKVEAIHIYPGLTTSVGMSISTDELSDLTPIKTVTLSLPEPKTGANAVVTSSGVTAGVGAFTVGNPSWEAEDDPGNAVTTFVTGKTYVVSITLTANAGFTFAGIGEDADVTPNAKINNANATIVGTPGATLVLTRTFDETRTASAIEVKTQPTLTYTNGDTLNLSALVVTLTYASGTPLTEDVSFANFSKYNIVTKVNNVAFTTAMPTLLRYVSGNATDHHKKKINISCGTQNVNTGDLIVRAKDLSGSTFTLSAPMASSVNTAVYTGEAINATTVVKFGDGSPLTVSDDYTVSYKNSNVTPAANTDHTKVGTITVTVTGTDTDAAATDVATGNYKGTKTATFTITPRDLSTLDLAGDDTAELESGYTATYDGTEKKPVFDTVTFDKGNLGAGVSADLTLAYDATDATTLAASDYSLSYSNNVNAGTNTAEVTLNGRGNFTGSKTVKFSIGKAPLAKTDLVVNGDKVFSYTGEGKSVGVSLKPYNATSNPNPKSGNGVFTLAYYGPIPSTSLVTGQPKDVGSYNIKVNMAAGDNFNAIGDLVLDDVLVINRADPATADFAPLASATYDGTTKTATPVVNSGAGKSGLGTVSNVRYNESTSAPKDAGTYTIKADIGFDGTNYNGKNDVIAGVFVINKRTPTAGDFNIETPAADKSSWTVTGDDTPKEVKVTLKSTFDKAGSITVKYMNTSTGAVTVSPSAPSAKGSYTVSFDVGEGDNFSAASGLSTGGTLVIQ